MNRLSAQVILRKASYWTRSIALHDAAHIVTGESRSGHPRITRYFLACGDSVTGGRVTGYQQAKKLEAHVCVGCVKEVTA